MKIFHCDHCINLVYFENVQCMKCKHLLAFIPDLGVVASLDPGLTPGTWQSPLSRAGGRLFRQCRNYSAENICNWAIPEEDANPLCQSCRLMLVIPNLSESGHRQGWYRLEAAKRRLIYTLLALGLPIRNRADGQPMGLAFEFLADDASGSSKILTGHAEGVITINIAEADDPEREKRRVAMHEPYRTLLGHFRHEIGHYYWDELIRDSAWIDGFRELFGDERADYGESLKKHYESGSPANWQDRFVSAYAASHPWEDWAETWAHYLHMIDALETASNCGVSLKPSRGDQPALSSVPDPVGDIGASFDELYEKWFPLTYMLNTLNRGLGYADYYPFILSSSVVDKLRFVHEVIKKSSADAVSARNRL
jgi:hypothetical protein